VAPGDRVHQMSDSTMEILVCDDQSELREALRQSFEREGHHVVAVAGGRAAIDHASTHPFDVLLLDVSLGRDSPDGYEVCRELRRRRNVLAIIMLTARDGEVDAVLGLEAGADDYVVKPFRPAELRSRMRAVLRRSGSQALGGEVLQIGGVVLDVPRRQVTRHGELVELTFSEFELLQAMMLRRGTLFSRQELLRAIWGDSAYRDPRGIDVHIRHLREKLEDTPEQPRLILTVRGAGYRINEN
jgi:DNA-binding response OmpR family regulator